MYGIKSALGHYLEITDLFEGDSIFADTNGDGYPDFLGLSIFVPPELVDPHVWVGVLNLTARLSSEVTHLTVPFVHAGFDPSISERSIVILRPGEATPYCRGRLAWAEMWRMEPNIIYLAGSSGKGVGTLLNGLAMGINAGDSAPPSDWKSLKIKGTQPDRAEFFDRSGRLLSGHDPAVEVGRSADNISAFSRKKFYPRPNLLALAGEDGFYATPDGEPRARKLRVGFALDPGTLSPHLGLALAEIIARLVLEATEIILPMVAAVEKLAHDVIFKVQETAREKNEIRLLDSKRRRPTTILARGAPRSLAQALKNWCELAMIESGPGCEPADRLRDQVKEFQELLIGQGFWGRWARFLAESERVDAHEIPSAPACAGRKLRKACHSLSIPGPPVLPRPRTRHRQRKWKGEVDGVLDLVQRVPPGRGELFGLIQVSKPPGRRKILKSRLNALLKARGYAPKLEILNAYKPGQSWLLEYILPRLKGLISISKLEISCRPFPRKGKCLELRSRWLEELYPAPELLVRELGLDEKQLHLPVRRGLHSVYRVRAWDNPGQLVFNTEFSPRWSRLPYLSVDPELGFVHPTTGGVKLWQRDTVILNESVATDREIFWRIFQNQWLPFLEGQMKGRLERERFEGQPAFWQEIRVTVCIEETDVRLGIGEERICAMEALHEDIYFVLLDAFSSFARRNKLPPFLQLGRIVPVVFSKLQNEGPFATLKAIPLTWAQTPPSSPPIRSVQVPPVTALHFRKDRWRLEFGGKIRGVDSTVRKRLVQVARAFGLNADGATDALRLWLKAPRLTGTARKTNAAALPGKRPPEDRLLTATEVENWIQHLGRLPQIAAWRAAQSWQGRTVWALEATLPGGGELISTAKVRLLKPTLVFNARHHANEISSTNAALQTAWFLAVSSQGTALLKHVNVAWIPMENPDGVATFEELQAHCKDHKLHAARYNALGSEYYSDYFSRIPRFPEARAKARLWRRWLPEIMVDHHGVPCHEWDQPFSGYVPFRFREFWIPRTFVYAYIPFIEDPFHPGHREAIRLGRHLGEAMRREAEILQLNRELAARYQRYAHTPEPRVFPVSTGEPLRVFPPVSRLGKINFAVRYPEVTRSEIIIEVPDEVASGRLLALCVQAHRVIEKHLMMRTRRPRGILRKEFDLKAGCLRLTWLSGSEPQKQE